MPPLPVGGTSGVTFCPHTTVPRELQKDHERCVPWPFAQADGSLIVCQPLGVPGSSAVRQK